MGRNPSEETVLAEELRAVESARQEDNIGGGNMISYKVTVNGIDVEASYSEQAVSGIFIPLLKTLTEKQNEKSRRILLMLAAPPGAGKSTLMSFLEKLSNETPGLSPVRIIGMDGFHRRQEYLLTHEVLWYGKQVRMVDIKGAPVTFDLESLTERIKRIAAGEKCGWPIYDRLLHNPVENAITIDDDIVLLEGNYLLLDEDGWRELSTYADYTVSVRAPEPLLRTRLIDRRIKTGVEVGPATDFVDFSDMRNVRLCLEHSKPADLQLELNEDGDYRIYS